MSMMSPGDFPRPPGLPTRGMAPELEDAPPAGLGSSVSVPSELLAQRIGQLLDNIRAG